MNYSFEMQRGVRGLFLLSSIFAYPGDTAAAQQEIGGTFCVEMFNIHKTCEEGGLEMEILQQSETILIKGSKNG